jgi:hypothetical protein
MWTIINKKTVHSPMSLAVNTLFGQLTIEDVAKRLEDTFEIDFGQVWMDRGDVDSMIVLGVLHDHLNDGLRLRHVGRPSDLKGEIN